MRKQNQEVLAFPVPELHVGYGMTMRDYFAAKAMLGLIASDDGFQRADVAEAAYEMADAMMDAREK